MVELSNSAPTLAVALLMHYSFDMNGEISPEHVIIRWANQYDTDWIYLAIIEALYQGRYKVFSAEQILNLWHRRGYVTYHFTAEFERLVCNRMPRDLHARFQSTLGLYRFNPSPPLRLYRTDLNLAQSQQTRLNPAQPRLNYQALSRSSLQEISTLARSVSLAVSAPGAFTHPDFILKLKRIIDSSQQSLPVSDQVSLSSSAITVAANPVESDVDAVNSLEGLEESPTSSDAQQPDSITLMSKTAEEN
ncbi:MAG: hypothetical protein HC835_01735 [Oscillatoriales cyanobacterium RM2_1_1]|nr:hypothetical protein [Oscillatoriales cyanobacterium SM2_3_0]NJO44446.1 hypothetical protein [Oscillatoriales cyanobacterium RM2_1_1]